MTRPPITENAPRGAPELSSTPDTMHNMPKIPFAPGMDLPRAARPAASRPAPHTLPQQPSDRFAQPATHSAAPAAGAAAEAPVRP